MNFRMRYLQTGHCLGIWGERKEVRGLCIGVSWKRKEGLTSSRTGPLQYLNPKRRYIQSSRNALLWRGGSRKKNSGFRVNKRI